MKRFVVERHTTIEWVLGAAVIITSLIVWILNRDVSEETLTIYDIFPVFGLLAFGLMWTHFVMGALRRFVGVKPPKDSVYGTTSMGLVLGLIILHPALLWLGLYQDGFGLPPLSHVKAYENQVVFVALGTLGLFIFLAYELKRWFGGKKWWKIIDYAQIIGMIAIFIHAIDLGGELRADWYMAVWWLYGVTLVVAIAYSEYVKRREKRNAA